MAVYWNPAGLRRAGLSISQASSISACEQLSLSADVEATDDVVQAWRDNLPAAFYSDESPHVAQEISRYLSLYAAMFGTRRA